MYIGDKVEVIKGNAIGKVGFIRSIVYSYILDLPKFATTKKDKKIRYFNVECADGLRLCVKEDQLKIAI